MTQHICSLHFPVPGLLIATGSGIGSAKAVCVGQHVWTCGIAAYATGTITGVEKLATVDDCGRKQAEYGTSFSAGAPAASNQGDIRCRHTYCCAST